MEADVTIEKSFDGGKPMQKLLRYRAYVDDKLIWDSNSVKRCKEKADHELARTGFYAEIRTGKKVYASRLYDEPKWMRHG